MKMDCNAGSRQHCRSLTVSQQMQVAVSCCRSGARDNGFKDSAANILSTNEFVVNIMSAWFVEAANHTCGNYDAGVNEFDIAGLTPKESVVVKPPRVAESAVHMECKLRHHWHVQNSEVCAVPECSGMRCSGRRAPPVPCSCRNCRTLTAERSSVPAPARQPPSVHVC